MTTRLVHLTDEQLGSAIKMIAASDSSSVLIEYFTREINSHRDDLERVTPEQLPGLQGRIHELRTLITLFTPPSLKGTVPPRLGA